MKRAIAVLTFIILIISAASCKKEVSVEKDENKPFSPLSVFKQYEARGNFYNDVPTGSYLDIDVNGVPATYFSNKIDTTCRKKIFNGDSVSMIAHSPTLTDAEFHVVAYDDMLFSNPDTLVKQTIQPNDSVFFYFICAPSKGRYRIYLGDPL